MQMAQPPSQSDPVQLLRDEFRHHLEIFYARLKLAPPYHSVEKAIGHLTAILTAMAPEERQRIAGDESLRWAQYRTAFVESGLNQKHRGIIAGLARSRQGLDLSPEYDHFLDAFTS
ncbi:MAG: hypothetical protein HY581_02755 [Nitrospirae bacterium]|nr:hypothetical protein [Nitrospirota bacterium]